MGRAGALKTVPNVEWHDDGTWRLISGRASALDSPDHQDTYVDGTELIDRHTWPTRRAATAAIFDYIEGWYTFNQLRLRFTFTSGGARWPSSVVSVT